MKRLIALASALLINLSAYSADFKEGVHYTKFADQGSERTVTEFFSYYCPHCHKFEPLAKHLMKLSKSEDFSFTKNHVDFINSASTDFQHTLTKATVYAEQQNNPAIIEGIFSTIHLQNNPFMDESDLRRIFADAGVEGEKFDKAMESFVVVSEAKKKKSLQDTMVDDGVIDAVPTFIVNGKYKIKTDGFEASTYGQLFGQMTEVALYLMDTNP